MKTKIITLMTLTTIMASCDMKQDNVLMNEEFETPYGVPPFEQIKYSDYVPAFEAALKSCNETVELIVSNRNEATFENTIIPFDRREIHLSTLTNILFGLRETENCDSLSAIAEVVLPMLTSYSDDVVMNKPLFERIKRVYDTRKEAGLDSSQIRVVEKYYDDFVRNGALLSDKDQETLRGYNQELSLLQLNFGNNLLEETNSSFRLLIDSVSDLAGLPEGVVASAAERAKEAGEDGKWLFTLSKASMIPFLTYSERQDLRKALYDGYCMRGNNGNKYDNKEILAKMATIRAKRAALLGYANHAEYVIAENMAKTPQAVETFLMNLWTPALKKANAELREMKNFAYRYDRTTKIEACDWFYWAEKLRKAKYDVDEQMLSEYFVLENVQKGMFEVATKLYGVTFKKIEEIPLYNPNNVVYEVSEANGEYIGLIYFDFHPRASKGGGAWCTGFRDALDNFDGTRTPAQVSIVCNFTTPTADTPALLTFDEVQTMFHEFGHGLHALFSSGKYRKTAGVVPRDYVELPSQIMEHWAAEPEVMKMYGRHYKSGDTIPDALIEKLKSAGTFNQGFATVEYLAASLLDLKWHTLSADTTVADVNKFEADAMKAIGLMEEIVPRYRSTYFAHIFDGGYSAGYYVYMWAELLDCDAFNAYKETGDLYNQDLAGKFRKHCLSEIGEYDQMGQYVKFRGQEPNIEYLLENRGLK